MRPVPRELVLSREDYNRYRERIAEMYARGDTVFEIAAELNLTREVVNLILSQVMQEQETKRDLDRRDDLERSEGPSRAT